MRNLPTTKSSAVTAAPTHTSRQATLASGSTLKIAANSAVITTERDRQLSTCSSVAETPSGSIRAERAAERRERRAQHQRHEQQEGDAQDHAEREHPLQEERLDPALRGIRRDPPGAVERGLELAERAGGAEHQRADAEHGRRRARRTRALGLLEDGADLLGRRWAPMSAPSCASSWPRMSWGSTSAPSSIRISTSSGGSGEDGVVGERRGLRRAVVLEKSFDAVPDERETLSQHRVRPPGRRAAGGAAAGG